MNKALFLDRDGVINKNFGHVHRIENFKFRKGIFELLKVFQDKGFIILVITNQAGIGKGLYTLDQFILLNNWMINEFRNQGISITKTYFCPHKPVDNCNCRKPKAGMLLMAIKEFKIDTNSSYLIGDKLSDIIAGKSAQIKHNYVLMGTISKLHNSLRRFL